MFKILIWKKFSRSKWTWLSIFILLLNWVVRIPGPVLYVFHKHRSLKLVTIHVLWISSFTTLWYGPLRCKTAASKGSRPPGSLPCGLLPLSASKYKEYIQGCISVLFSYKVGNVFWRPQGGSPSLSAVVNVSSSSNITQLQVLVNNFFIFSAGSFNQLS